MHISNEIAHIRVWHKKALEEKNPSASWHVPVIQVMPLLDRIDTRQCTRKHQTGDRAMTPAELREKGEELFGKRWQTKLAKALPVSDRSIRHWLSGKHKISPVIEARINSLQAES